MSTEAQVIALTAERFAEEVEEIVWDRDVSYIEATIKWCEDRGIDPENIGKLVKQSPKLASNIQEEAEALHYIPRGDKLPF